MKERSAFLFPVSALLLLLLVAVLYPFCRYYVDPDAVACFAVIRRYVSGDYAHAVNAYWSPLSCWLSALLVKAGMAPMPAAVAVNAAAAVGVLAASLQLFRFFGLGTRQQGWMAAALAVFLSYAVYKQLFADLWEVFFLLLVLKTLLHDRLGERPLLWIWLGCLGGWAYYAKAYALPFFLLQTLVFGWWRLKGEKKKLVLMLLVSWGVLLLWALPWMYLLYQRYGVWMSSSAGRLNLSWYLVGHPYYREGIELLLPPPYADSPSYWEDPYLVNGPAPVFYSSGGLLLRQGLRLGQNFLKFCNSLGEQSALMLPLYAVAVLLALSKELRQKAGERLSLLALAMLLFPMGFWLINFEARYLWYLVPCAMILAAWLITQIGETGGWKRLVRPLPLVLALSFVVWPVWDMKTMIHTGREEYQAAQKMQALGIRGSFASNAQAGEGYRAMSRLAHFSGNAYYYTLPREADKKVLLQELRRYGLRYYLHLGSKAEAGDFRLTDEQGVPFPELGMGHFPGMQVFVLQP